VHAVDASHYRRLAAMLGLAGGGDSGRGSVDVSFARIAFSGRRRGDSGKGSSSNSASKELDEREMLVVGKIDLRHVTRSRSCYP
jgi:hypothetical protein